MAILLLVLGLLLLAVSVFLVIFKCRDLHKDHKAVTLNKKTIGVFIACLLGLVASGCFIQGSINIFNKWALTKVEALGSVSCAGFFFGFSGILWTSFFLYFYKPDFESSLRKKIRIAMFGSIPLVVIAFLVFTSSVGNYLSYPLPSGFAFSSWKLITFNAKTASSISGFKITFYGIFIIVGALVTYFISDHRVYKRYGKHGLLEGTLFVGLLCGIIGARAWYVIGNWNGDPTYIKTGGAAGICFAKEVAKGNWTIIFQIWQGGLTILGGAVGGIIGGVAWTVFRRRELDIRWVMDMVIPGILIAQVIGRWGNFFNCEVYGVAVDKSMLSFLPNWIVNQMSIGCGAPDGKAYVPLFLLEGAINLVGYFVIAYLVPFLWKKEKGRADMTLTGCYLLWYGVVRIILEPLRDPNFNMGTSGSWSIWNSLVWIIMGVLVIVAAQVIDLILKKKAKRKALEEPQDGNQAN